jgi:hypothetical protein
MDYLDCLDTFNYAVSMSVNERITQDASQNVGHRDDTLAPALTQAGSVAPSFNLENYAVLEQFQDLYLLQAPQTALFYVWAIADELPLFQSTSWPAAYRTWLAVRHKKGQNGTLPVSKDQSLQELHDWVNRHQDHPLFGQLIYRRDRHCEDLLQYAIQLSDEVALRWAASDTSTGALVLEPISRRQHRPAKWVTPQPQSVIKAALHGAIKIFHQHWAYSAYRFNSEHLARLIVTGHCGSFQMNEKPLSCDKISSSNEAEALQPEILEFNLEAESLLTAAIAPHQAFTRDTSTFTI